jgi:hypothetical protein
MPPALPTREARARALWLDYNLHHRLEGAVKHLGSEDVKALFVAIQKGLAIQSLQGQFTASERLSSVSPHKVNPYHRVIWLPVGGGPGVTYAFDTPVYRMVGIKRSPAVLDVDGLVIDDWLEEGTDYTWNAATSTITFADDVTGTVNVTTGYNQVAVLDENEDPRYVYTPTYADVQITGEAGYALVDEAGDPITEQVLTGYVQGDPLTEDDLEDPITEAQDTYLVPTGTYYVVEALQENPYMWDVTAASIGFLQTLRPLGFTPEHVPHLLQAIDSALLQGFSSNPFRWALSALAGNPFAYGAGRIVAHELAGDVHYVVVENVTTKAVHYCEVPQACNVKASILKPVGFEVALYEPLLLTDPVTVVFTDVNQDAQWGPPVMAHQLGSDRMGVGQRTWGVDTAWDIEQSAARDLFPLGIGNQYHGLQEWNAVTDTEDDLPLQWGERAVYYDDEEIANFAAGTPLLVRNPRQGWSAVYSARRSDRGEITVDGYLPDEQDGDLILLQALVKDAEQATTCTMEVWAPALKASRAPLQWLIDRVIPGSVSVSLTLLQQAWGRLYCDWETDPGAWHQPIHGQRWESAFDLHWHFIELGWSE